MYFVLQQYSILSYFTSSIVNSFTDLRNFSVAYYSYHKWAVSILIVVLFKFLISLYNSKKPNSQLGFPQPPFRTKFKSKKEIFYLLSVNVKVFLLLYKCLTIYLLKDLISG